MREIKGTEMYSWCMFGGLSRMGGDSLLTFLCGNLLKVGSQAKRGGRGWGWGVGSVGRLLLLA